MCNFIPNLKIIALYISILSYIFRVQAEGISCFKCLMSLTKPEDTELLCSYFDASAKFQVFCPASTLCMKKTIQYKSKLSVVTTVQRDCAPQKYSFHNYNESDQQWYHKEEVITTAYEEGCFIGEHRGAPTSPPEYCFCGFQLCNLSSPQFETFNKVYGTIAALLIMRMW